MERKREISLKRADELKSRIQDYLDVKDSIPKGLYMQDMFEKSKKKIMQILNATESDWNDYKWQLTNRITDAKTLSKFINLSDEEIKQIDEVGKKFRWAISPYYLSLINPNDKYDPIKLLSIPTILELSESDGHLDPMGEEYTNPAGSITRRYPDRLIINVTNECAMYCRHCQRRRNIGQKDQHKSTEIIQESIDYIKSCKEIREVLLTGGDPLTLSDERLEWILKELRQIPHVEIIRIGSRTPVTMPQRITDNLVNMLKKYHPIYLNTHFNHPQEITQESKKACEKLADAGIPLGNQAVLLNGINNDKYIMRALNHELLKIRVKPYYIFHAKQVKGTTHFNTSIDDGLEIMEYLRGYTSGMAIPTYIVNAPKGQGKTPIFPQYILSRGKDYVMIRTWEGNVIKYKNNPTVNFKDIY
ncbi:lysine 2,3-aminomutase [Alkalithermobacter thermoalcaliphilus JW-YL-7 = DSM 7308]|uniref:Lysine 2,3-aminomutase n=1 Tax=Alkalithermobacter thermoalcaliphilus JW-YL-7 = DSM 7308 TaxID=1121328 RepID=A0A150FNA8_CLOPD|nr:lysine 2,3-aminomutase YodO family protein [[Clostridium] paradoxum JW-YL-7 = DSM 7308]SHL06178.1 lysine 2,3-aminomutase [[Clostridium] paradoxum JW-YL-7 = DSM 7308]